MSDLPYKIAVARECAAIMEQKLIEKEPRPSWRETPISLSEIEAWLRREVEELLVAPADQLMREAADVANMAAIYADVKRRAGLLDRCPWCFSESPLIRRQGCFVDENDWHTRPRAAGR